MFPPSPCPMPSPSSAACCSARGWVGGDTRSGRRRLGLQHRRGHSRCLPGCRFCLPGLRGRTLLQEGAMSAEMNKVIVRRFVEEVQNGGDLTVVDELAAPGYVNHSAPPGVPADREGLKQLTAMFRRAFPDGRMTIEDMVAEGDRVATRKTFRGTHQGELMGIPPTGQAVAIGLIDIVRVMDGQVVESWNAADNLGLLRQIGALP